MAERIRAAKERHTKSRRSLAPGARAMIGDLPGIVHAAQHGNAWSVMLFPMVAYS
jgi:hypothetical protein